MSDKVMDYLLQEIVGAFFYQQRHGSSQQTATDQMSTSVTAHQTRIIPYTPRDWQIAIMNRIATTDIFLSTPTGGGKSLPIMAYWVSKATGKDPFSPISFDIYSDDPAIAKPNMPNIVNILSPSLYNINTSMIPKIIWLTPFRNLNESIYSDIVGIASRVVYISLLGAIIGGERIFDTIVSSAEFDGVPSMANMYRELKAFLQHNNYDVNAASKSTILGLFSTHFAETFIVGNVYEGKNTSVVTTRTGPTFKPIIVSIYESFDKMIDGAIEAGLKVSQQICSPIVVFDEVHIIVTQNDDREKIKRANKVGQIMRKILLKLGSKGRVVLLTGTMHQDNVDDILYILKNQYNRTNIYCPQTATTSNPAKISVRPLNLLAKSDNIPKLIYDILQSGSTKVVFLIFSKSKIVDITKRVLVLLKSRRTTTSTDDAINRIGDPLLREAAINGFGYIVRKSRSDPFYSQGLSTTIDSTRMKQDDIWKLVENDNIIMQELFRKDVIRVLLVTDSIEAGVNLNIKEMYIPKFEKGPDQELTDISKSQILNRVGRSPVSATIYTPDAYVGEVTRILSGGGSHRGVITTSILGPVEKGVYYYDYYYY